MAGPRRINVVSVLVYLFLGIGAYASVQYVPILWKKTELESLIKEHSYGARRVGEEEFKKALVEDAGLKLGVALEPEDVTLDKLPDRVKVEVRWRFTVDHPFGMATRHAFLLTRETVFYR